MSPGTSNCILKSEEWKRSAGMNEAELRVHAPFVTKMNALLSDKPPEEWASDPYLYPNEMGDELAGKVPPVVILTAEFDSMRYSSLGVLGSNF